MIDRVGERFGNYVLTEQIGRGGFAEVYLGKHKYLKTVAAIKVLRVTMTEDDLEDFLTEARLVAHLRHPHIVRVLECAVENEVPFLVMEYAPNGTLRQRHPKGQQVPLQTILPYVRQVADALQYAHDQKLIHRDVKPENMLIDHNDAILLSDFGTATAVQSTVTSRKQQELVGTIHYTAPEQLRGKACYASDQYSLAMVIYEWLSGTRPFRGTFEEVMSQHMLTPPPPLHEKVPGLPLEVERVVFRALAKLPQYRFSSMQEFATALEEASHRIKTLAEASGTESVLLSPFDSDPPSLSLPAMPVELSPRELVSEKPREPSRPLSGETPAIQDTHKRNPTEVAALKSMSVVERRKKYISEQKTRPVSEDEARKMNALLKQEQTSPSIAEQPPGKEALPRRRFLVGLLGLALVGGSAGAFALWEKQKMPPSSIATATPEATSDVHTPDTARVLTTPLYIYRGHAGVVNAVAWSPDGTRIASGSEDQTVQVWDSNSGKTALTYTRHVAAIRTLAWRGDNSQIASGGRDTTVQVWDAATGDTVLMYHGHRGTVNVVAWAPDTPTIASSTLAMVQIWDGETGTNLYTYHSLQNDISALAWSPDGKMIASGHLDTKVRIWEAETGRSSLIFSRHTYPVKALAWQPHGELLASGDNMGIIHVWRTTTGEVVQSYARQKMHITALAWSPDGTLIASAAWNAVHVWEATSGKHLLTYRGHNGPVFAVSWSPDGTRLASASEDKTVHIWQAP